MRPNARVWLRDAQGVRVTAAVAPAAWRGQRDCVVGPFSNTQSARAFILLRYGLRGRSRVFPSGPAFYVELPG